MAVELVRSEWGRPFPALTVAQRFHFEAYGYVIVPGVFSREQCGVMVESLKRLRADLRAAKAKGGADARVRGASFVTDLPHRSFMVNLYEYDQVLLDYVCDPKCVGMAEEVMGCEARVTEVNAYLNSREPGAKVEKEPVFDFHTGVDAPFGAHVGNGLYHCNFVKTLTTLVDLGPDDGGTVVIAGSHKFSNEKAAIKAAYEDRSLIHQVMAPAGSTLLFCETLIHATGQITGDKERAIIIAGYGPPMYPRWDEDVHTRPYSEEFVRRIPEALRTLFLGRLHWNRLVRYRSLDQPVDGKVYEKVKWG